MNETRALDWSWLQAFNGLFSALLPFWRKVKSWRFLRRWCGFEETLWIRLVQDRETRKLVRALEPARLRALEISGLAWRDFGFKSYACATYPAFDICNERLPGRFDIIIAEHVFEHLLRPYRAGKNVHEMLETGGYFLVVTPFLIRVHPNPHDCTRWTETGLQQLLIECGFDAASITTGSWGNRSCVRSNFLYTWPLYNRFFHSLRNEWDFPVVVWALARK